MKYAVVSMPLVLFLVLGLKGCGSTKSPAPDQSSPAPQRSQASDYASLINSLRAGGAKIEPAGEVSQPFFSAKGKVLKVNGGDVQVFEYKDPATADKEASRVSADGSEIGRNKVGWVGPPHFYKKDKLIALYVGDSPATVKALEAALGNQFAGK